VSHDIVNKPAWHEAYIDIFVEQPNFHSLNACEDNWYHKLDAKINIQNMFPPSLKWFL